MDEALVARVRYHIQKANFMGLKDAESTLLLAEAAEAIEELQRRVPKRPHGRLIDADALRQAMYHEAFETDSPMQKWDSGCWIRYKMFERVEEAAPTIIPAEEGE